MLTIKFDSVNHRDYFTIAAVLSDSERASLVTNVKNNIPCPLNNMPISIRPHYQHRLDELLLFTRSIKNAWKEKQDKVFEDSNFPINKSMMDIYTLDMWTALMPISSLLTMSFTVDLADFTKDKQNLFYSHSDLAQKNLLSSIPITTSELPRFKTFYRQCDLISAKYMATSPYVKMHLENVTNVERVFVERLNSNISPDHIEHVWKLYHQLDAVTDAPSLDTLPCGLRYRFRIDVMETEVNNFFKLYDKYFE